MNETNADGGIVTFEATHPKWSFAKINKQGLVTEVAEKKVCYEIRKSKKNYPSRKIILTGCAAQINPIKYEEMEEVHLVIGNKEKLDEKIWKNINQTNASIVNDIFKVSKRPLQETCFESPIYLS